MFVGWPHEEAGENWKRLRYTHRDLVRREMSVVVESEMCLF